MGLHLSAPPLTIRWNCRRFRTPAENLAGLEVPPGIPSEIGALEGDSEWQQTERALHSCCDGHVVFVG
jgi:hypothetical protein